MWLYIKTLTLRGNYIHKVSERVSMVYTHLYILLKLAPVSVAVMKFRYFKAKKHTPEHYEAWMPYEAVDKFQPAKHNWQGITVGQQMIEYLITNTVRSGDAGLYIEDIENMEDGDFKDYLLSQDGKSFYSILINYRKEGYHVLLLIFNYNNPRLSGAELSNIRITARNIEKLMFKKVLSFSDSQYQFN
jgi:hypothetical protein